MTDRLEAIRGLTGGGRPVPVMGWVEGALAEAAKYERRRQSHAIRSRHEPRLGEGTARAMRGGRGGLRPGAGRGGRFIRDWPSRRRYSPAVYRELACLERRIFDAVRQLGGVSACTSAATPPTCWMTWPAAAPRSSTSTGWWTCSGAWVPNSAIVCGNIDPVGVLLQGTPDQVRDGVRANAAAGGRQ